jgi:hypothetical protein
MTSPITREPLAYLESIAGLERCKVLIWAEKHAADVVGREDATVRCWPLVWHQGDLVNDISG